MKSESIIRHVKKVVPYDINVDSSKSGKSFISDRVMDVTAIMVVISTTDKAQNAQVIIIHDEAHQKCHQKVAVINDATNSHLVKRVRVSMRPKPDFPGS